jgi:hypothetical protein
MSKRFVLATLAAMAMVGSAEFAFAEQKVFESPRYKNLALDWCKSWATDCGKPAADAWCVKQGYESASGFNMWDNLGEPTRIISNNQICDQPDCDSFTKITCQKTDVVEEDDDESEIVKYNKPMAGGRRLDWCLTWATNCGQPAADFYCKSKGHGKAIAFKIASDIGKTRILKTNEKCTQPDCDGFKSITCE